jgi:RNA polymerase sigma factor (sigma-70 family)
LQIETSLIRSALGGDVESKRVLVEALYPIIARRVAAALWQRKRTRSVDQDVNDFVQDVFVSLLESDGKALRAWDPARGMSFERFVGMLAQHQVASILRNGRTSPWRDEATDDQVLEKLGETAVTPESITVARQDLRILLDWVRSQLSPRGLELFQRIFVSQEPLASLTTTTGMSAANVYQWKSRMLRALHGALNDSPPELLSETKAAPRIEKGAPRHEP